MSITPYTSSFPMSRYAGPECFKMAEQLWNESADKTEAVGYYWLSARYAHPGAMLHLGLLFYEGLFFPQDDLKAKEFFRLILEQDPDQASLLSPAAKAQRELAATLLNTL